MFDATNAVTALTSNYTYGGNAVLTVVAAFAAAVVLYTIAKKFLPGARRAG